MRCRVARCCGRTLKFGFCMTTAARCALSDSLKLPWAVVCWGLLSPQTEKRYIKSSIILTSVSTDGVFHGSHRSSEPSSTAAPSQTQTRRFRDHPCVQEAQRFLPTAHRRHSQYHTLSQEFDRHFSDQVAGGRSASLAKRWGNRTFSAKFVCTVRYDQRKTL